MERSPFSTRKNWEKSTPPNASPIGGMMMSLTSELTMPVKDAPMITPTARSMTLPRMANFLNSSSIILSRKNADRRLVQSPLPRQAGQPPDANAHGQARQRAHAVGG